MHYVALTFIALAGDLALALLVAAFMRAGRGDHSAALATQRIVRRLPSWLRQRV